MALPVTTGRPAAPDESLVARAVEGDRQAFDSLYERYLPRVYALAARHSAERTEIESVVEESFELLVSSLYERRPGQAPSFAVRVLTAARTAIARRANGSGRT
ncbi:MAG: hypothetical protein QNK04_19150 [Myxococcota bacterium]|nr:hypothetical protein [Myxococcota bacterium]